MNNCHDTIKFDFKNAKASIDFEGATGFKNKEQNKLLTTAYERPKDQGCFLRYTSARPKSLINSIPYSQSFRLKKKIILKVQSFLRRNHLLKESFTSSDFNEKCLDTQYRRLSDIERNALRAPSKVRKIEFLFS